MQPAKNTARNVLIIPPMPPSRTDDDIAKIALEFDSLCASLQQNGIDVDVMSHTAIYHVTAQDAAIVTADMALIAPPQDNQPDLALHQAITSKLAGTRVIHMISPPGRFSGRDAVRIGDTFFISRSLQTNDEGAAQAAYILRNFGYEAHVIPLEGAGIAHIADGLCDLGDNRIWIHPALDSYYNFLTYEKILMPEEEKIPPFFINNTAFLVSTSVQTGQLLKQKGIKTVLLDIPTLLETSLFPTHLCLYIPESMPHIASNQVSSASAG